MTLPSTFMTLCGLIIILQCVTSFYVHPSAFTTSRAAAAMETVNVGEKIVTPANEHQRQGAEKSALARYGFQNNNQKNAAQHSLVTTVHGGSLRTWSFPSPILTERVQVVLTTEGRPLNADIDLWHGPDNTPQRMAVYIEDGALRPFNAIIETPNGQNTVAIRNTASMEYPFFAAVASGGVESIGAAEKMVLYAEKSAQRIQGGGAIKTYIFGAPVESVQVFISTDGFPLNAKIELLQGPNNNKQVVDIYTEDGLERPFYAVIETPGTGNVFRIVNTGPMEYPISACVEPFTVATGVGAAAGGKSSSSTFTQSATGALSAEPEPIDNVLFFLTELTE